MDKVQAVAFEGFAPKPGPMVPVAAPSEADAVIQMIERAVRDPSVDINKMRELLSMRKEIVAQANQESFDEAMTGAQADMGVIIANAKNTQTHSKYATYDELDRAIRPIYTQHGFSVSYDTTDSPLPEHVRVVGILACRGHREPRHIDIPCDGKGAKGGDVMTKTHAMVSAVSYGRRAILIMAFNLAIDRDDDGNAASRSEGPKTIDATQYQYITKLVEDAKADEAAMLAHLKADDLNMLTQAQYKIAETLLKKKIAIAARKAAEAKGAA